MGFCMLITPYLDGFNVDPETKQVLGVAVEMTRVSLGLADDFANGIIAKRVIELAKAGERNPGRLCEGAIEKLPRAFVRRLTGRSGLRVPVSRSRSAVGGNRTHLPASATNELVELGTARVSALWAEHLAI